mgnify:CR=1 FL=1|jgi:KipI family sensor histidine kinase inhibitor
MTKWSADAWSARQFDGGRWLLQCEEGPSPELSQLIGAWAGKLRLEDDVLDAVPGFRELAVTTSKEKVNWMDWLALGGDIREEEVVIHTIEVSYNGEDLGLLAESKCMTRQEVMERHQSPTYTVGMLGFCPHFPYLLGLDPLLATPRLETPRLGVPAGSVAIGGEQTGIYPQVSPGGWLLIGSCDPKVCQSILPGHQVVFRAEG